MIHSLLNQNFSTLQFELVHLLDGFVRHFLVLKLHDAATTIFAPLITEHLDKADLTHLRAEQVLDVLPLELKRQVGDVDAVGRVSAAFRTGFVARVRSCNENSILIFLFP